MVRLYVSPEHQLPFVEGSLVSLSEDQVHYVRNVLRLAVGDKLSLFNGRDGEWHGSLETLTKSKGTLVLDCQLFTQVSPPFAGLVFAPIKHDPLFYLIEKTTELGVTDLYPVLMERSSVGKINIEKAFRNGVEASQQCERLDVPDVHKLQSLREFLEEARHNWPSNYYLVVCRERDHTFPLKTVLEKIWTETPKNDAKIFFLIGPEGGISPEELQNLSQFSFVRFCHLGPRILRAETAAAYALTVLQICV